MPFQTVPVLMYHHVSPTPGMITITPENFDSQMAWLVQAGYTTLDAAGFARFLAGEPVPAKSVLLTFDDGFLDNWVYAHPILARHGLRATLFIITGQLGNGPVRATSADRGAVPDIPSHHDCEAAVAQGRADDVMLRWSEIQAMQAAGTFDFHSHTHTHTRWDKQDSDARVKRAHLSEDIAASRHALQSRLGGVSSHLCWPQGYFDADYVAEARAQGFTHLYTTDPVGQNVPGTNPGHIHRITAKDKPAAWLSRRLFLARHRLLGPLYDKVRY